MIASEAGELRLKELRAMSIKRTGQEKNGEPESTCHSLSESILSPRITKKKFFNKEVTSPRNLSFAYSPRTSPPVPKAHRSNL